MSLVDLSKAWFDMRYQLSKTQEELEELRMHIHQFAACKKDSAPYLTAKAYLSAVAIERHEFLKALSKQ